MTLAVLFALFFGATLLFLALRRGHWSSPRYYWPSVAILASLVLLTGFVGHFAWRNHESIRQLKALVDLPPYDKSVYVPRGSEIRTIARLLPANVPPNFPLTRQENERTKNEMESAKDLGTFWLLETSSRPDSVRDFYEEEQHRQGWEIAEQSPIDVVLKRQNSTLEIFFLDDFPRPGTGIVYIFRETSGAK
jgi:hypothetical protein